MATRKIEDKKEIWMNNKGSGKILTIIFAVFCVLALYLIFGDNADYKISGKPEVVTLSNVFIDVDGDGLVDFVSYIEYIPNTSPSDFIIGQ